MFQGVGTSELPEHTDFRLFLQDEFLRRCRRNPKYSVRAFAKLLDVDFSALAKILKGSRPIGPLTIEKFSVRLGLSPEEIQRFQAAVLKGKRAKRARMHAGAPDDFAEPDYQQLTLDSFQIISDWYHYAILELIRLDSFKPSLRWIAKSLGITLSEAQIAVERLQRAGILEITPDGKWLDHSEGRSTTIGSQFSAAAFRNLQRQVLEGALRALEQVPMERRDQSSMTMAIDEKRLPEAKEKIRRFRRELAHFLSRGERRGEVYQMSISLYPITHLTDEKRREDP